MAFAACSGDRRDPERQPTSSTRLLGVEAAEPAEDVDPAASARGAVAWQRLVDMGNAFRDSDVAFDAVTESIRAELPEGERDLLEARLSAHGVPESIWAPGLAVPVGACAGSACATAFFLEYADAFDLGDVAAELDLYESTTEPAGRTVLRFQQRRDGLRVEGAQMLVQVTAGGGVHRYLGHYVPGITGESTPVVSAADAAGLAALDVGVASDPIEPVELMWIDPHLLGAPGWEPKLAWRARLEIPEPTDIYLDALTGETIVAVERVAHAHLRAVYDANGSSNNWNQSGVTLVFDGNVDSGCPLGQGYTTDCTNAQTAMYNAWQFYDDMGYQPMGPVTNQNNYMRYVVRSGKFTNNADWRPDNNADCTTAAVYASTNYTAPDLVAHEIGHGVNDCTADLPDSLESGAVKEHMGDAHMMGIDNDWGLPDPPLGSSTCVSTTASCWRSLSDPPSQVNDDDDSPNSSWEGDPDSYFLIEDPGLNSTDDKGRKHSNGGMGNKAAFLLARDDVALGTVTTFDGVPVTTYGRTHGIHVFDRALIYELGAGALWPDWRIALLDAGASEESAHAQTGIAEDAGDAADAAGAFSNPLVQSVNKPTDHRPHVQTFTSSDAVERLFLVWKCSAGGTCSSSGRIVFRYYTSSWSSEIEHNNAWTDSAPYMYTRSTDAVVVFKNLGSTAMHWIEIPSSGVPDTNSTVFTAGSSALTDAPPAGAYVNGSFSVFGYRRANSGTGQYRLWLYRPQNSTNYGPYLCGGLADTTIRSGPTVEWCNGRVWLAATCNGDSRVHITSLDGSLGSQGPETTLTLVGNYSHASVVHDTYAQPMLECSTDSGTRWPLYLTFYDSGGHVVVQRLAPDGTDAFPVSVGSGPAGQGTDGVSPSTLFANQSRQVQLDNYLSSTRPAGIAHWRHWVYVATRDSSGNVVRVRRETQ